MLMVEQAESWALTLATGRNLNPAAVMGELREKLDDWLVSPLDTQLAAVAPEEADRQRLHQFLGVA